ncbi:diacylglycerol kinase [Blastopirellula marina]|uniref:Diacylglycerol kinase n=1 Tax=Blastopirellula marina TaxID=124 RepID=A0A2S8FF88_9BACT|nr:diacylglycerol kinase [Blastopirellula marina]PQO30829.1 diacylglycerol kinase [Blastopirellula marina]PTL42682.1 diacylglycerol kinase [Blastopirellula marina]
MNLPPYQPAPRTWIAKFRDAFRGIYIGVRAQSSFVVHLITAAVVVGLAAYLRVDVIRWSLLLLCIALVLAAELFNSAIEWLAKAIDHAENEHLRNALDVASGAVLVTSIGAAIVGGLIFLERLTTT